MKRTNRSEDAMKVTMLSVMCGPDGNAFRGQVLDLPKEKAEELINGKFARIYDHDKDKKARVGLIKAEK